MRTDKEYEYDVAFSFAGEKRDYVRKVFNYVEDQGIKVFFDETKQADMWGQNLLEYFKEVFETNARFCVMFISKEYKERVWTNFERQIIEARSLIDNGYILPARFDDTEIAGLPSTIGYVNANKLNPEALGDMIIEKVLKRKKSGIISSPQITFRQPKVKKSFNPYEESKEWIEFLTSELKTRCNQTETINLYFSEFERNGKKCLRFILDGETIYSLDITMGGVTGDKGLSFHGVSGELSSSNSYNGWGNFVWDKEKEIITLKFTDMSLLSIFSGEHQNFTRETFLDAIWNIIVDVVETKER